MPLLAAVAGAVVLALVGAPQSPSMVFMAGPDSPAHIGPQLAIALSGALAMAVGVLSARRWPWLISLGAIGVVVATALHAPKYQGLTAKVVGSSTGPAPLPTPVLVGCLVAAAAGVLVIGLFGAVGEMARTRGAALAGFVAVAGYYGVAIIGPLRSAEPIVRLLVVAVAAVVAIVAASLNGPGSSTMSGRARVAGVSAALAIALPTAVVAITGGQVSGTFTGGVVGLVVLGIAFAASVVAGVSTAVLATGLVLAAPVVLLIVIHDGPAAGGPGYAWPIALAGLLVGMLGAMRAGSSAVLLVLAALPFAGLASGLGSDRTFAQVVVWALLFLVMAAAAATAGIAFRAVGTPVFAPLATAMALGVFGTIDLWRAGVGEHGGISASMGTGAHWISVALLLCAVPLVLRLRRA